MHHHLDAYAYTSRLKPLPPQQKLLFALVALLIALVSHPLTQGLIFIWISLWIVGYARIPVKVYGRVLGAIVLFLVISLPALIVEVESVERVAEIGERILVGFSFRNWFVFISQPGILQAIDVMARSLACVSCLLLIGLTIPFSELLTVLRHWCVPSLFLDLLLLMYRFIFLFLDVALQLELAQRSRGGYRTRQRWFYSVGLLAGQLMVRSLQRYQHFSLGLAARGFNGDFQVYTNSSDRYSRRYAIESLIGGGALILLELRLYH